MEQNTITIPGFGEYTIQEVQELFSYLAVDIKKIRAIDYIRHSIGAIQNPFDRKTDHENNMEDTFSQTINQEFYNLSCSQDASCSIVANRLSAFMDHRDFKRW
ncbi:MAG: hypothetical protein LBM61_04470 [Prevotellaceae bacterium]|jgi:hypothetical protein|nr:hypothetical protein [Prevotellaceae bacterium]